MEDIIDRLNARIRDLEERVKDLEDCEEAKIGNSDNIEEWPQTGDKYWYVYGNGEIREFIWDGSGNDEPSLSMGNCFKTKEEAEQVVEKLKAWKRLKDAGFEFTCCNYNIYDTDSDNEGEAYFKCKTYDGFGKDLQLLFGGDDE